MTGTIRIQVRKFCEAPRPSVQGNQVRPGFSHGGVFRRMKDCKGLPGYLACFVRSCSENASNFKNLPNPAVGFTDLLGFLGIIFNQRCHLICLEMAWWIPGRLCWLDLQLKVGPEGFMVVLYGAVSVFVLKRTMNSVFFFVEDLQIMNQVRIGKSGSDHLQSLEGKDASLMTWCTMLLPGQVKKTGLLPGFHEMYRAGRPLAIQRAKQRQYRKTVWVLSLTIDVHLIPDQHPSEQK